MKKILAMLLVVVFVAGLFSVTALAGPFGTATACKHEKTHTEQDTVQPTCTEAGYIRDMKVCNECGEVVTSKDYPLGEATGHAWEDGICTVCGEESPFGTAPKCEHEKTHTKQEIVEATCTEDGYIRDMKVCDECGEVVTSKDYPLEAEGHAWEDGVCVVCGEESPFSTAPKCEHEKTHTKQLIVEPTCTEAGYIRDMKVCDECGEVVTSKDYPLGEAEGHAWEDGVCVVCGEESPFSTAPKCEHEKTHTKQLIVDPTCTEDGYIRDMKVCDECGEVVTSKDYPVEAKGHKWEDGVCAVCGEKSPFSTAPDNSKPETDDSKPSAPETSKPSSSEDKPTHGDITVKPADSDAGKDMPNTGDNSHVIITVMCGLALVSAVTIVFFCKKRNNF